MKKNRIRNILKYYDIILPLKGNYEYNDKTSKEFFAENHDEDVWNKCKKLFLKNIMIILQILNGLKKKQRVIVTI